ncbi:MAG: poly-gamma-glutamate hydrolase family protein [Proteobacteria bacterium]|nr:poly-gamma-glutamate hydrolase family protein [Pseudomonadota bacterium]
MHTRSRWLLAPTVAVSLGYGCDTSDTYNRISVDNIDRVELALHQTMTFEENAGIGDREHCRLPAPHGAALQNQQVRIERPSSHTGLCTVTGNSTTTNAQMNATGLTRRLGWSGGVVTGVTVRDTYCNQGQSGCEGVAKPVSSISQTYSIPSGPAVNQFTHSPSSSQVAYTAPHGAIELKTAEQVELIFNADVSRRNSYWTVGYKRAGGSGSNFNHYHITSTEISELSFSGLDDLLGLNNLDYAVSFHGCSGSCPTTSPFIGSVNIGGAIEDSFRIGVAELIAEALPGNIDVTAFPPSAIDGDDPDNYVNRLATGGRGLQVEQSSTARSNHHDEIAEQVKEAFDCLIDSPDNIAGVFDDGDHDPVNFGVLSSGTLYTAGECNGYLVNLSFEGAEGRQDLELHGDVRGSEPCPTDVRIHNDFYRQRTDGTWQRIGGGWRTRIQNSRGVCQTINDADYVTPRFADVTLPGLTRNYRGVVRATDTSGQPKPVIFRVETDCHGDVLGGFGYCLQGCPCRSAEGDCDGNLDCFHGTTCVHDVGAAYGFSPTVDVCEPTP